MPDAAHLKHRSWITVTAKVDVKRHPIYEGVGPWLKATNIEPADPPQEELVYFLR